MFGDQDFRDIPDYTLLSERRPVARKDHTCEACKETIKKGERHSYAVYILDGKFETMRCHAFGVYCGRDE